MNFSMGGPGRGAGGGGTENTAPDLTPNGISRSRYIDVTDQVRRMPVSVVMVIDQSYLQDVLAAFSNSDHMRYQITQYHWKRVHLAATTVSDKGEEAPGPM